MTDTVMTCPELLKDWSTHGIYKKTFVSITEKPTGLDQSKFDSLKGYHPDYGLKFETYIEDSNKLRIKCEENGGWGTNQRLLLENMYFVCPPLNWKCLVVNACDPGDMTCRTLPGWKLNYAKLEKVKFSISKTSINRAINQITDDELREKAKQEYQRLENMPKEPVIRSLILQWYTEGFSEYVFTCWKWID